jgi:hypothetical protein
MEKIFPKRLAALFTKAKDDLRLTQVTEDRLSRSKNSQNKTSGIIQVWVQKLLLITLLTVTLGTGTAFSRTNDTDQSEATPAGAFAFSSISVEGSNLVFGAAIPSGFGFEQVILEMRPALTDTWSESAVIQVQRGVANVSFTIPKPSAPMAFFRLKAAASLRAEPLVSSEMQYVAVPSLSSKLAENGDAVFHFRGIIDGSDKIMITRAGAFWTHANWGWPNGSVAVNGNEWNPKEKNYLTTTGAVAFLPKSFSLDSVQLETIQGRAVVALERADNALIIYLDDTPRDADTYEFKVLFHPANWISPSVPDSAAPKQSSAKATLKVAARIDGSDCLKITATEASWTHTTFRWPSGVTLNGIAWTPRRDAVLRNEGTHQFLPSGIDFSSAQIVFRKGRDLATMWSDKDAIWIRFADNPNGHDDYELEVSFGGAAR